MYGFTPTQTQSLLVCPACKHELVQHESQMHCSTCGQRFRRTPVPGTEDHWIDLRIEYPTYCTPPGQSAWEQTQATHERVQMDRLARDSATEYTRNRTLLEKAYLGRHLLQGRILDIGGHLGTVRQFVGSEPAATYLNLDPFPSAFAGLAQREHLLAAYPVLAEPCPFIAGHAERLPFARGIFETVNLKSVLDHLADPYVALLEARRVLSPDGKLVIGSIVEGGDSDSNGGGPPRRHTAASAVRRAYRKLRSEGSRELARSIARHATGRDTHLYHWSYANLTDLVRRAGFRVDFVTWLDAPLEMVVYVEASPTTISSASSHAELDQRLRRAA